MRTQNASDAFDASTVGAKVLANITQDTNVTMKSQSASNSVFPPIELLEDDGMYGQRIKSKNLQTRSLAWVRPVSKNGIEIF